MPENTTYDFERNKPYLIWKNPASESFSLPEVQNTISPELLEKFCSSFLSAYRLCFGSTITWDSPELSYGLEGNGATWLDHMSTAFALFEDQHKVYTKKARIRLTIFILSTLCLIGLVASVIASPLAVLSGIILTLIALWAEISWVSNLKSISILFQCLKHTKEVKNVLNPHDSAYGQLRAHVLKLKHEREAFKAMREEIRDLPSVQAYFQTQNSLYIEK